jgi:hypothetical protein
LGKKRLEILKNTAKMYGFILLGKFEDCEDSTIAKARQKNIKNLWSGSGKVPILA